MNLIDGTKVLITGGTGSLGTVLAGELLNRNCQVTILSRNPHRQAILLNRFPSIHKAILADIRDRDAIFRACRNQDIVIHAAALKRVERGETDTREYVSVNVTGSVNVADAAADAGVKLAILISTDKAPRATTLYGSTKRLAEGVWMEQLDCPTLFTAIRYGNVVGSSGSVYHIWKERVRQDLPLIVKYPAPTRFFLTKRLAVEIVIEAIRVAGGRDIIVPGNLPSFSLHDLARKLQPSSRWNRQPLGPGEKQHEILVMPTENPRPISSSHLDLWRIGVGDVPADQSIATRFSSMMQRQIDIDQVIMALAGDVNTGDPF